MNDATTPMVEPGVTTLPATLENPNFTTYEECSSFIEKQRDEKDAANLHAALNKLQAFFKARLGKKTQKSEIDGNASVKRAMESRPKFNRFEPKPVEEKPPTTGLW